MLTGLLALFTGLAISMVAIYYSVLGLAAIFSASVIPIIVMGVVLESSKLVAAWWLKWNWHRAPAVIKYYLLAAVLTLMLITSMGIFGFLSKAHSDQAIPTGDAVAQIEIIDQFIESEQQRIQDARSTLALLDDQIREFTDLGYVTRGIAARNEQQAEREFLNQEIQSAQARIAELRADRAPVAASLRALEAEVGPIRYIAQLIYGQDLDTELLERAVVWVIVVIVLVFDPLAVLLLLSAQMSFVWHFQKTGEYSRWLPPSTDTGSTLSNENPVPPSENDLKKSVKKINLNNKIMNLPDLNFARSDTKESVMFSLPTATEISKTSIEKPQPPSSDLQEKHEVVQEIEKEIENQADDKKHHIFEEDIRAARKSVKKK